MTELEQHHIRYKEIHGEDEIIMLSHAEHAKVHKEDRANGFKSISEEIIQAAHLRSPQHKAYHAEYLQSKVGKAAHARHERSEKGKVTRKRYTQSEKGRVVQKRYRAKQKEMKEGVKIE